jgi:hypothetical protein
VGGSGEHSSELSHTKEREGGGESIVLFSAIILSGDRDSSTVVVSGRRLTVEKKLPLAFQISSTNRLLLYGAGGVDFFKVTVAMNSIERFICAVVMFIRC